jgi:transcriptional regulator with XRE-family HTH domain
MAAKSKTPIALRTLKPGLSLRQLSKRTGLAMPHLSRVVNGRRGLTVRVARLIALATGRTLEEVVAHLHVNGHKRR